MDGEGASGVEPLQHGLVGCFMFVLQKSVENRNVGSCDQISMNRSMVGIPLVGARNPHCPEYPLIHEILVGIPSSGDSVQWGFGVVITNTP